ncbi:PREDICTED: protein ZGRF1 isoform X1 [Chinchilla lanigera]|uniref:protein ZGRF1 isoform X1 n=1 Tax=Chinchilla lanigera TaxID=34839 RepID=UPI00038EE2E3|nr:PREDICTED: protein ZGRF1 isoform X1 [Chinchilla lanigera]XP_013376193.1 PREDICTED: protein ZGRF1 isoform X1 [Chinchilla lanigera]XP_013376194.1 PREDICTED: protein ZGRF1 isoform X1 [Chinchilla lanigera]XP_013376195.1 PREDICTED: protein ZGRF1 isoform X1 [Chinchilla lanigera]XP_013376196.1 PREDICTED: protein ZGRF1 isoform X1 [Chinchilla lanigera]XP_013376197.1 PREDICTED: protein ZGRF1 isoform X1 [Chinchilla lanigera]XP_013376198.1 PREDICTED: protein ZGRF1 isoform X1 [Chinchilla lanigera]XP_0
MESQEFIVLYTHQKTKKAKVWQDGTLKLGSSGNKAVLHDDKGACLESLFLKCLEVKPGDDLESDRYLITVEEVKVAGRPAAKQEVDREAPGWSSRSFAGWSRGCQPPGLKRKFTGFQGPRQVPKKIVVMENGDSSASFEAGTTFSLPCYSTLPLFPTVGRKEISNTQTAPDSTVSAQMGAGRGPGCPTRSEPSPGVPGEEDASCALLGPGRWHAAPVLATEPTRGHGLASHCPRASKQHIRSQSQILALLKSTPATTCEHWDAELAGHSGQLQTLAAHGAGLAEHAEMIDLEQPHGPRQPENAVGGRSHWAVYLSPQGSPADSSKGTEDMERQAAVQGSDIYLNLEDPVERGRMQAFGICAEKAQKHHADEPGDSNECWQQEGKLETPSFCGSSSLLVSCAGAGQGGLLSKAAVGGNNKVPFSGQDQGCTGEAAQAVDACGPPGQDCPRSVWSPPASGQWQAKSSLSQDLRTPDDIEDKVSGSDAASESLEIIVDSGGNGTEPFSEVTFNLSNFETSDTEEESQESSSLSPNAGGWGRGTPGNGSFCVQKPHEIPSCREISSEHLPCLMSVGDKWTEKCPVKETLSQFCDKTCVGFDPGPCEGGNPGEEEESDPVSSSDLPSAEGSTDGCVDSTEDANGFLQNIASHSDLASLSSKSKGTSADLPTPDFLNIVTGQTPKNSDLLSRIQPQPFISGSELDKDTKQVSPPASGRDSSIQLLNSLQDHSERTVLGKSGSQACNSLLNLQETKQPLYRDTEVYVPECDHLERSQSLSCDRIEVEAESSTQSWSNPSNSSELCGVVSNISLLKSLSEHSTALESVDLLKRGNAALPQHGAPQVEEPESRTEARKPFIVMPFTPHLKQDSQQTLKENEVEPSEPLQTPQPVEFQGHQVTGSARSVVIVRGPSLQPRCGPFLGSTGHKTLLADAHILLPELPGMQVQTEPSEVASPEQRICMLSPVSAFSLDLGHDDFMVEFSEESLRARTLPGDRFLGLGGIKRFTSLENKNLQRLKSEGQAPHTTSPPAKGPQDAPPSWARPCSALQEPVGSAADEDLRAPPCGAAPFPAGSGGVSLLGDRSPQSKWQKYQSLTPSASRAQDSGDRSALEVANSGGACGGAALPGSSDPVRVQMLRAALRGPRAQDSRQGALCSSPRPTPRSQHARLELGSPGHGAQGSQEISSSELCFPSGENLKSALPKRQTRVPAVFQSPAHYRQTFSACIIEHLNILLFGLAQRLHRALSKADITFYTSSKEEKPKNTESSLPCCHHRQPATLVMAKKEGPNKGRLFYACDRPKAEQCKFFKWLEEMTPGGATPEVPRPSVVLSDLKSLGVYLRGQRIPLYEECQLLVRKGFDFQRKPYGKLKKFTTINPECYSEPKSKLYLKLSRKESSSIYSKDDLWVISKTLDFALDTFVACSAFFGPSSANEVELLPLKGYFPSRWPTNVVVHALLVCNASSELTTLKNIQEHFHPGTLPLTPHLLAMSAAPTVRDKRADKRKFTPPAFTSSRVTWAPEPEREWALRLADELGRAHGLNEDQAAALSQVARMLAAPGGADCTPGLPVTLIHGVFGAGKSYLLAVVVLFFVRLFEQSDPPAVGNARPWKLLISSSTNVAVDRVLLGLLSLGFEKFVRVGSVRKIAKPILPYSLHAGSENENEQLKELHALMKEDLTPTERVCVRRSIEQHRLGTTRTLLRQVLVVGVTCAACPFPCMSDLKFPVVVLDECSQMTEPTSLLPIARFECEKLILVGDPKQLPPTIQGSEAAHENGLEQTLFDRLCLMGHKPVPLRTQYRCHPAISAVANDLFYGGNLRDGVSEVDRGPLLHWLPTLCFYNVAGQEQIERDNSFHNAAEASFTLKLIQSLIASGIEGSMIGVITLYKSQMYKLSHSLSAAEFGHPDLKTVQVSTVDAFQGAEKEIIILSCVRTRHVGFIDSETRVNVALTRGRRHLLIVGNLACLRRNGLWGRVIQHCEGREDGLQQASQCEPQLNRLLKDYLEKQAEEKQKKKNEKERSKEKSHSQNDMD